MINHLGDSVVHALDGGAWWSNFEYSLSQMSVGFDPFFTFTQRLEHI